MATKREKFITPEKWEQVNVTNKEIYEEFRKDCKSRGIKANTAEQYCSDVKFLAVWLLMFAENKTFMEITKKDIRQMILYLVDVKGQSNNRVNRILSVCRSLLTFLAEEEVYGYTDNLSSKIKNLPKQSCRDIVFLDDSLILDLYDKFMKEKRYRDATLLALAYESAGRKSELAQVQKNSITKYRNNTNIVTGKRNKRFPLLYFKLTLKATTKYLEKRGDDGIPNLFVTDKGQPATPDNLYDWVRHWRKDVEELTGQRMDFNVHSFRHSALQNYSSGTHEVCRDRKIGAIAIDNLSIIAHHESIEVTLSYLKKDTDDMVLEKLFNINVQRNL